VRCRGQRFEVEKRISPLRCSPKTGAASVEMTVLLDGWERTSKNKGEMRGSLHCATHKSVSRFGRDDDFFEVGEENRQWHKQRRGWVEVWEVEERIFLLRCSPTICTKK